MAVRLAAARAAVLTRALPEWTCRGRCGRLQKHYGARRLSVGCPRRDEEDGRKAAGQYVSPGGRRRPLSPLERVSRLLPRESLGPEVEHLRERDQDQEEEEDGGRVDVVGDSDTDASVVKCSDATNNNICETETRTHDVSAAPEDTAHVSGGGTGGGTPPDEVQVRSPRPTSLPGETAVQYGELLIAEFRKKNSVAFHKMFQVQVGARLNSPWGAISHDDIAGRPSGWMMRTEYKAPFVIRRPSLEDYVLNMKRSPVITYPKDASMMLTMMDVSEGDSVLESGSGSGAMSLFLSRAVGSKGTVLSVEVREDHLVRAVKNYDRWRLMWSRRRGDEWPDNVEFRPADLCSAAPLLEGREFHSVALDLINPHLVLPTVIPHLHSGAVCAVYLANITQIADLLEGIRCSSLPLLCERIIEVPVRDWLVAPARQKDGDFCTRKSSLSGKEKESCEVEEKEESTVTKNMPPFGSVPYIARPHPEQLSHTAFLVKLRKYEQ